MINRINLIWNWLIWKYKPIECMKVGINGTTCIMRYEEGHEIFKGLDPWEVEEMEMSTCWYTQAQLDDMPDFMGW